MKNRHKILVLIFSIILGFFFNLALLSQDNSYILNENEEFINPELAAPLKYSDIHINDTKVYRLFEHVNFTIYTSDFVDADHVTMQISFSNDSVRFYSMNLVEDHEYYYNFKPEYNAPLEFQNVSFLIYDDTNTLLNDHTSYTGFTITTNYLLNFNSPEYYIGDNLTATLLVSNFSSYDFQWNFTVVDSVNELTQNNLLNLENNRVQYTIPIDNETFSLVEKTYYIKLNMSDKNSGKKAAAYFPFDVRNNVPIITSDIVFSPNEIYRTDPCTISLNATDVETLSKDLSITMYVQDAEGANVLEDLIRYDSGNFFSDTFNIPSNKPAGKYRINVTARDEHGGESSKVTFLTVKNNLPEIHSYKINGMSMDQSISIRYGENLIFSFNVSDIEGIAYVTVALLNENNEWFNITRAYRGESTEISIRTVELITGTWFVYIYVIDSDGAVVSLTDDYDKAPQGIRIIPDVLSNYLPWILFFFGLSLGIIFGIGIIYRHFKSKYAEPERISLEKKKPVSKELPPKKKDKTKPSKLEFEKKDIEALKEKKEEEKEETLKRKIKRKL